MVLNKINLYLLNFYLILFLPYKLDAQEFEWVKSFGGDEHDVLAEITVDEFGNVYSIGRFRGSVDFDPGPDTHFLSSVGATDIFIHKIDSSGNFLWAKTLGGPSGEDGLSIALDHYGNVYATGSYTGTVDFDPGVAFEYHTSSGFSDAFVLKLDSLGNFLWAKSYGGATQHDEGRAITIDNLGNVFIAGKFQETVDFDPNDGTSYLTSNGNIDIYIQKLNVAGEFIWARSFGGNGADYVNGIKIDLYGNIFTTGRFGSTVDFDPGEDTLEITALGYSDVFVHKMDNSGAFSWAKSFGGSGMDYSNSIALNGSDIYTVGYFRDTVDFDPGFGEYKLASNGGADIFVHKMHTSGIFLWAKSFGAITSWDQGRSVTIDNFGNVYVSGNFVDSVDFDPSDDTALLISNGGRDGFILKMTESGNYVWAHSFEGDSSACYGQSIVLDAAGNLYTGGYFSRSVDFDPGMDSSIITSEGLDVFIHKMAGVVDYTNIDESVEKPEITVYPNPSHGIFTLVTEKPVKIKVLTIGGKIVHEATITNPTTVIDLHNLETGIYIIQVTDGNYHVSEKLIIK